jgi:hypothetical protein
MWITLYIFFIILLILNTPNSYLTLPLLSSIYLWASIMSVTFIASSSFYDREFSEDKVQLSLLSSVSLSTMIFSKLMRYWLLNVVILVLIVTPLLGIVFNNIDITMYLIIKLLIITLVSLLIGTLSYTINYKSELIVYNIRKSKLQDRYTTNNGYFKIIHLLISSMLIIPIVLMKDISIELNCKFMLFYLIVVPIIISNLLRKTI